MKEYFSYNDKIGTINYADLNINALAEIIRENKIFPGNVFIMEGKSEISDYIEFKSTLFQVIGLDGIVQKEEKGKEISLVEDSIKQLYKKLAEEALMEMNVEFLAEKMDKGLEGHTDNPQAFDLYLTGLESYAKYTETDTYNAISYFEDAIKLDPSFTIAYAALADSYLQLYGRLWNHDTKMIDKAFDVLAKINQEQHKTMAIYKAYGLAFQSRGAQHFSLVEETDLGSNKRLALENYNLAIEYYGKAIELSQNCPVPRNNLAVSYLDLDDIDHDSNINYIEKARELLRESIARNPFSPSLYNNLGTTFLNEDSLKSGIQSNYSDSARIYFNKCVKYSGGNNSHKGLAHYNLACLYSIIGPQNYTFYDSSMVNLEKALELNGYNFELLITGDDKLNIERDSDLDNLRNARPGAIEELLKKNKNKNINYTSIN